MTLILILISIVLFLAIIAVIRTPVKIKITDTEKQMVHSSHPYLVEKGFVWNKDFEGIKPTVRLRKENF